MTKYDTKFGHCNDFKVANKKLWDFHLISKLTDWNLKLLESEDVWKVKMYGFYTWCWICFLDSLYS